MKEIEQETIVIKIFGIQVYKKLIYAECFKDDTEPPEDKKG